MIEMRGLCKTFRTDHIETRALRPFDLSIVPGDFISVSGPSGSGKTTFVNLLGLLEEPTTGSYLFDGRDVNRMSDDERSAIRNEKLGFVFQGFNLLPDLSVYDNIDVPLRYRNMPAGERRERINSALGLVGLVSRARHVPAQLSGGQQQRVAIARALAGAPSVLVADEPTGNLDSVMSGQILDLMQSINAGGTVVIMVTHSPELAQSARRRIRIMDGVLTEGVDEEGSPQVGASGS